MASRDRSQGFGFVYMNLTSFLSANEPWSEEGPLTPVPSQTINFNKDSAVAPAVEEKPAAEKIRENLDRLQTLHQRLHVMLEEIGQIRTTKKDPKGDS
jgi:hypothetical protein